MAAPGSSIPPLAALAERPRGATIRPYAYPPIRLSRVSPHNLRHLLHGNVLDEVVIDHDRGRETAGPETLHLDHRPVAVLRRHAEFTAAGRLEQCLYHVFRSANVAGRGGTDLHKVLSHRVQV